MRAANAIAARVFQEISFSDRRCLRTGIWETSVIDTNQQFCPSKRQLHAQLYYSWRDRAKRGDLTCIARGRIIIRHPEVRMIERIKHLSTKLKVFLLVTPILHKSHVGSICAGPGQKVLRTISKSSRLINGKCRGIEIRVEPVRFTALVYTKALPRNVIGAVATLQGPGVVIAVPADNTEGVTGLQGPDAADLPPTG